jgi:hypothetical protein
LGKIRAGVHRIPVKTDLIVKVWPIALPCNAHLPDNLSSFDFSPDFECGLSEMAVLGQKPAAMVEAKKEPVG